MKKLNFISILLCGVLAMSIFSSCGDTSERDDNKGKTLDYSIEDTYVGTHIYNVESTNSKLIESGMTEYTIVIPSKPDKYEQTAINELLYFFEEATGIELPVISDEQVSYSEDVKYISVGNTAFSDEANVVADYNTLKSGGFRIFTKGKSIFLKGATGRGTLYAVYEFLSQCFDYEYYADNAIFIKTNVRELPLMNYDITDIPDYEYNLATYGFIRLDEKSTNRYRMVTDESLMIPVGRYMYHNSFEWLPKEEHRETHPDWYSDDGGQLCYAAHGIAEEYEAMIEAATNKAKELLSNPAFADLNVLTLTQEDGQAWCMCSACKKAKNDYGSNAAVVIKFVNRLKANIDAWFETEGVVYKRDLKLLFFGYHQTNTPPVIYNESTQKYAPVDDSVKCVSGVAVYFAETNGDYTQSFNEANNADIAAHLAGYGSITNDIYFWSYEVNYSNYVIPYNSFNAMQGIYQFAKKSNAFLLFDQGTYNENGRSTAWCALKAYLSSKLAWDVNADFDQLIVDFFTGYFGPAAEPMLKMFNSYRIQAAYNEAYNGYNGSRSIFIDAVVKEYWPKSLLQDWLDCTDAALTMIEPLKQTESDKYMAYSANIRRERLSPLYLMIELYNAEISEEQITEYKIRFYKDAQENGLEQLGERSTLENLYEKWGLN